MYAILRTPGGDHIQREDGAFIPDDPNNADRQELDRWLAAGNTPAEASASVMLAPETISDRQFAQALALAGTITRAEALAWAARGDLPKALADALAKIPEDGGARFGAQMMLSAATTYERHHPLTGQLGALLGYDDAALDALWTSAARL